ncbi:MAG TPA: hypothetical protein PKJ41_07340 [Bryobacteraceae bacterium]|nr:hypothetical protein [Bryobacteraceae bacterium]HPT25201.1 hypothetical protein [Bryobacteraceae bacterium]
MRQICIAIGIILTAVALRYGFVRYYTPKQPSPPAVAPEVAKTPEEYLSPHLRILMFYSAESAPPMGRPATVCYGVLNAVSVRLDPPLAEVTPSLNRCIAVTVHRPQMLTLTATGKDGEQAVAAFRFGARRPRAAFTFVQLSTLTPKRGELVTLCYGTNSAESVRLLPDGPPLRPGARACAGFQALADGYRLVAESRNGRDEAPLPLKYRD